MENKRNIVNMINDSLNETNKLLNNSISDTLTNVLKGVLNEYKIENKNTSVVEKTLKGIAIIDKNGKEVKGDNETLINLAFILYVNSSVGLRNDINIQANKKLKSFFKNHNMAKLILSRLGKINKLIQLIDGVDNLSDKTINFENELNNININLDDEINKILEKINNELKKISYFECSVSSKARNKAEQMNLLASGGSKIRAIENNATIFDAINCINKKIANLTYPTLDNILSDNKKVFMEIDDISSNVKEPKTVMSPKMKPSDLIKLEGDKIVIVDEKENKILKDLVTLINKKGFYNIKINIKNVIRKLKLTQFTHTSKLVENEEEMINKIKTGLIFLAMTGLLSVVKDNIVNILLPKFFLDKENFETNYEDFMDIISKNPILKSSINMGRPYIKKLFIRINRDGDGKAIFSNMIDSLVKLGLSYSLLIHKRAKQIELIPHLEYFTNFVIENIATMVSNKCRSGTLEKELFDNGMKCIPPKTIDSCPKPEEKECPVCQTPTCPEPVKQECPTCPECEVCAECETCPEPIVCPTYHHYMYGGIITVLLIILVIMMVTGGKKK